MPVPNAPAPAIPTLNVQAPHAAVVASPEDTAVCDRLLASGKVKAEHIPAIADPGGCEIPLPLKLSAILLQTGSSVAFDPPVTVRCSLADALSDWVRQDLVPLLASRGGGLAKLAGTSGYQCRSRDHIAGAKLSEHATGNAIDISAMVMADRSSAKITDDVQNATLFAQMKLTSCARFMTVLGPGSDGFHANHLHLDLASRRNGTHICQWQLP